MDVENEGLKDWMWKIRGEEGVEANLITNERSACRGDPYTSQRRPIHPAANIKLTKLTHIAQTFNKSRQVENF